MTGVTALVSCGTLIASKGRHKLLNRQPSPLGMHHPVTVGTKEPQVSHLFNAQDLPRKKSLTGRLAAYTARVPT
jgi:hypothetical protein